jgi:hypothetical protein
MRKRSFILILLIMVITLVPNIVLADAGACPLGKHVTEDLQNVLDILKIAGPLLVVGFTIFEGVKALTGGDSAAELKKVSQRLVKRLVYCVLLFAIPILVEVMLKVMDVIPADGGCDLDNMPNVSEPSYSTEGNLRDRGYSSSMDGYNATTKAYSTEGNVRDRGYSNSMDGYTG